jgi:phosphoglycolate phosphatase-like HAD superfamily hydrolase
VIRAFQQISYGSNNDGLIRQERWLPSNGLLDRLSRQWRLAIFTGRMRWETEYTLRRFSPDTVFAPIVCMEDVAREKPDPEGLFKILQATKPSRTCYVGDTMDDCRAAQAAGVEFIGVSGPENPLQEELAGRFRQMGARAVISDVSELERILV